MRTEQKQRREWDNPTCYKTARMSAVMFRSGDRHGWLCKVPINPCELTFNENVKLTKMRKALRSSTRNGIIQSDFLCWLPHPPVITSGHRWCLYMGGCDSRGKGCWSGALGHQGGCSHETHSVARFAHSSHVLVEAIQCLWGWADVTVGVHKRDFTCRECHVNSIQN